LRERINQEILRLQTLENPGEKAWFVHHHQHLYVVR